MSCFLSARVDRHREACRKVIEEKLSVLIGLVRINHVGLPRSGKTSFLKRLMGIMLNILEAAKDKEEPSTGVAERADQVFVRDVSKNIGVTSASAKSWTVASNVKQEAGILNQIVLQSSQASLGKYDVLHLVNNSVLEL